MEKYRKVVKPKSTEEIAEDEIRVTAAGSVSAYVSRVAKVFTELEKPSVTIKATGGALTKAVTLAEVVKRRFKGLHQITSVGSLEVVDEYEPIEEGLDPVTDTRTLTVIEIKISKEPLDTSDKGYQAPIDEALVTDYDPDKVSKSRGRGKGKGKSKGKGKGKGKEQSAPKGKGKGKAEEPKGKGKGKTSKGKGKGKEEPEPKGKGKGKRQRQRCCQGQGQGEEQALEERLLGLPAPVVQGQEGVQQRQGQVLRRLRRLRLVLVRQGEGEGKVQELRRLRRLRLVLVRQGEVQGKVQELRRLRRLRQLRLREEQGQGQGQEQGQGQVLMQVAHVLKLELCQGGSRVNA
ncbi:unnamed protein product [Prorocentrum cordatum]|uniref:DNA/RNA-binding protein Alba-like domain-containing protein n=1 Tax=Prorocentrum cordatum TaxID=2364126 RepID=A0ABN9QVL3_9DINO|nr:unnamed protein product [Polarella glacialis]